VVSLYCRVDPGESQREVRARRLVDQVLELAAAGGPAAIGPQDCLWAGSMFTIETLLVRDGAAVPGVVCDGSRWLAALEDLCPVCRSHTRYTPDVLDELAAAVIGAGGSARQIAADLMPEEYLAVAKLRFPPRRQTRGAECEGDRLRGLQLRVLLPGQPAGGPADA
jgi:hypothetical protein